MFEYIADGLLFVPKNTHRLLKSTMCWGYYNGLICCVNASWLCIHAELLLGAPFGIY